MVLIIITIPTTSPHPTSQTGKIVNNDNNPPCKYHVLDHYKSNVMLAEQLAVARVHNLQVVELILHDHILQQQAQTQLGSSYF